MRIQRDILIERPVAAVFAFVADPANDPQWCSKVQAVKHLSGPLQGPGAEYEVTHRPIPIRPPRDMTFSCVSWSPPTSIEWREDDGDELLRVRYALTPEGEHTRFSQHDEVESSVFVLLRPLMRVGMGHDISGQLRSLKALLEQQPPG